MLCWSIFIISLYDQLTLLAVRSAVPDLVCGQLSKRKRVLCWSVSIISPYDQLTLLAVRSAVLYLTYSSLWST